MPDPLSFHFGFWDVALVAAVSLQATSMAYLHHPKWKAVALTLPIPFTVATLALGERVDATNAVGLIFFLLFAHGVRVLHYSARLPIVAAIVISAVGYCVAGTGLAQVLPKGALAFWSGIAAALCVALVFFFATRRRSEPGHRSALPVWIKLPAVAAVIVFLVLTKQFLRGFMTMFPMMGVIVAYEARHSLWTICGQIPVMVAAFVPMMILLRVTHGLLSMGVGLALGWVAFLAVSMPLSYFLWFRGNVGEG